MKKIIKYILIGIICFTLAGCGSNEENNNNNNNNNENNNQQNNGDTPITEGYDIKSTDDKLVFTDASGMTYSVFYFENDKIIKYESVINYQSSELANTAYKAAKDDDSNVKVSVKGSYLILEEETDEYDDLNKAQLEEALELAGYKINRDN